MRILIIISTIFLLAAHSDTTVDRISDIKEAAVKQDCRSNYAILINMGLPSNEKRWFVVDLKSDKIVYQTYVAHGKGSGLGAQAEKFSDEPGSYCTALGIYKIKDSCYGEHGLSYLLDGLESTNKNALSRGIIIHSAWYAEDNFISGNGRCGNSWGCPAISASALKMCKPYLKPGTLVWIYK